VAVGGRTGRDGIHGATFSSIELETESETTSSGAVQIGNAIVEKKMLDVILQAQNEKLYTCITDCGAGGFSSAVGEMGETVGAELDLEKAPLKYGGLAPWEILLSEAQERMVLAVPPHKLERFLKLCADEDVEATVIGRFTGDRKFTVRYDSVTVCDMSMKFLHDGLPRLNLVAEWSRPAFPEPSFKEPADLTPWLVKILSSCNVASKEWVVRQYDHEVQGGTVIKPLQGRSGLGPGDAAVIAPKYGKRHGIAVSNGMAIRYGDIDPYWMAASAIDEALRGIVAVGGDPDHTAILDNFCWGNPTNPRRLGDLVRASRACHDIATALGTPFISGKDSFHNEFATGGGESIAVPPTLLISAVARVNDISKCVTMDFKEPGNPVFIVGMTHDELGGSQYYQTRGFIGNNVPEVDAKLARDTFLKLAAAMRRGTVRACHDCSDGGIAVAVAEMAFSGETGVRIATNSIPAARGLKRMDNLLFSESNTRFIVEVDRGKQKLFAQIMQKIPHARIGEVTDGDFVEFLGRDKKPVVRAAWKKLLQAWRKTLLW
jgi:phosphoribosylformylglycinamidine synthase